MNRFKFRLFLAPDDGGNSAGTGQGDGQQQQGDGQPSQTEGTFVSPFKDVDRSLLDDVARQAIEKAEVEMQKLHTEAQQKREFQSRHDRLLAQNGQLTSTLQSLQKPTQAATTQQTTEQYLVQYYLDQGIPEANAKSLAKLNAPLQDKMKRETAAEVEERILAKVAPFAASTALQHASSTFQQVMSDDPARMYTDEVKEFAWSKVKESLDAGQVVSSDIIRGLADIGYAQLLRQGKIKPPETFQQPQRPMNPNQQTSRFNFPGAGGNHAPAQRQQQANPNVSLDPETAAAIAATTASWPGQKHNDKNPFNLRVTRSR
jgi:hypothetical protein